MTHSAPQLNAFARPSAIGLALQTAQAEMRKACQPILDTSGLTYAELLLLEALWEADGSTLEGLAHAVGLPVGVAGLQLDRLATVGVAETVDGLVWLMPDGFALRRFADDVLASPSMDRARLVLQTLHVGLAD